MLQSSLQVKFNKIETNILFTLGDGCSHTDFHKKCDNKGSLIILYTVKETGRRGGAVTFKEW